MEIALPDFFFSLTIINPVILCLACHPERGKGSLVKENDGIGEVDPSLRSG